MNIVVLGATRGMGREVARLLAERGDRLLLLGRDSTALQEITIDLKARGADEISHANCDLAQVTTFQPALDLAVERLGRIDAIIVTAGLFGTQEQLESDPDLLARVLDVDFTKTILWCEAARAVLMAQGGGQLVVFSSVAGDTSRKTVGLYGAAKAGLSHYLTSLDLRYRSHGLITIVVKPGFIRTGMTAGLKEPPVGVGEPDQVARDVIDAMQRGTPQLYTPSIWKWVMLVIRHLPRFIMRRVGF